MVRRQDRIAVVLDTNVMVRALTNSSGLSASARVYRLWLQRQIQLVVSAPLIREYLNVLLELPATLKRMLHFQILSPAQFLKLQSKK
jgi:predicted nucleic acid-binding protein